MSKTAVDIVLEELRRDGRGVMLRKMREAHGLSRNQVADALGISPNDVYRAEERGLGSKSCPDAVERVRRYLWQVSGYTPEASETPATGEPNEHGYRKGDIVHVIGLEGTYRYVEHNVSPKGKVSVTVYGGPGFGSAREKIPAPRFRVIDPVRLGRVIRRRADDKEEEGV